MYPRFRMSNCPSNKQKWRPERRETNGEMAVWASVCGPSSPLPPGTGSLHGRRPPAGLPQTPALVLRTGRSLRASGGVFSPSVSPPLSRENSTPGAPSSRGAAHALGRIPVSPTSVWPGPGAGTWLDLPEPSISGSDLRSDSESQGPRGAERVHSAGRGEGHTRSPGRRRPEGFRCLSRPLLTSPALSAHRPSVSGLAARSVTPTHLGQITHRPSACDTQTLSGTAARWGRAGGRRPCREQRAIERPAQTSVLQGSAANKSDGAFHSAPLGGRARFLRSLIASCDARARTSPQVANTAAFKQNHMLQRRKVRNGPPPLPFEQIHGREAPGQTSTVAP